MARPVRWVPRELSDGTVWFMGYQEEPPPPWPDPPAPPVVVAWQGPAHVHELLAPGIYGRITCADPDCTLDVRWDLGPPPDFGKSGMASWTNTDAPG